MNIGAFRKPAPLILFPASLKKGLQHLPFRIDVRDRHYTWLIAGTQNGAGENATLIRMETTTPLPPKFSVLGLI